MGTTLLLGEISLRANADMSGRSLSKGLSTVLLLTGAVICLCGLAILLFYPKPQMPDVLRWEAAAAQSALEELGLQVSVEYIEEPGLEEGLVFRQSPEAGSKIKKGMAALLYVNIAGKDEEPERAEEENDPSPAPSAEETATP